MGAPRGTLEETVARLNAAVNERLSDDGGREELARLGGSTMPKNPASFRDFVGSETARYAGIIRDAAIRPVRPRGWLRAIRWPPIRPAARWALTVLPVPVARFTSQPSRSCFLRPP
ncbi:hypothetical protein D9599_24585 [Roseomonas sp. KE2513]|nr:hypothetical protein [Roseomonas sp. KE2513]